MTYTIVDLFSGTGGASQAFKDRGAYPAPAKSAAIPYALSKALCLAIERDLQ